jgi:hypothetical protein
VKFPFPFGKQIWDIKEGENGSGTGINSRATCRKMCCLNGSRKLLTQKILQIRIVGGCKDFPHEVRFSAGIGPAHFLAETTRPLRPRLSAIFTSCLSFYLFVRPKKIHLFRFFEGDFIHLFRFLLRKGQNRRFILPQVSHLLNLKDI